MGYFRITGAPRVIPGIAAQDPVSSGGGGSGIPATLFDNSSVETDLVVASQTEANNSLLTVSCWAYTTDDAYYVFAIGGSQIAPGWNTSDDFYIYMQGSSGQVFDVVTAGGVFGINVWHHIYIALDMNHAAGSKIYHLLIDGVVPTIVEVDDTSAAFSINLHSQTFSLPFNAGAPQAYADVWINFDQALDPATYLSKFRDPVTGKPVPLGSDGSIPTGSAPTYFFTGGASSFVNNAGTGQQPTVNGTPTDFSGP